MTSDIYRDLPFGDYRALAGVNWSHLKLLDRSPLHYHSPSPDKDTPARGLFRAVHAAVLEPHVYDRDFVVYEGRRDKRSKAYQAVLTDHPCATILKPSEDEEARGIAAAVRAYPAATALLDHADAMTEASFTWSCSVTGIECKGRADYLLPGHRIELGPFRIVPDPDCAVLIDLKNMRSVSPREMSRDIAKMGYHGQGAHYCDGVAAVLGVERVMFGILGVESNAPHAVGLEMLSDEDLAAGAAWRDGLMRTLAECSASGVWPGPCPEPRMSDLPTWAPGMPHDDDFTFTSTTED